MTDSKKKSTSGAVPSGGEETASPYPDMILAQEIHRLVHSKGNNPPVELLTKVFEKLSMEIKNPTLYRKLQDQIFPNRANILIASCKLTPTELSAMEKDLETHLLELETKVEEAVESAGEMEVMDARLQIARFAAKSLSVDQALEMYQKVLALPKISSGKQIDALMESARVASFYGDIRKTDELIEKADKLANSGSGGDWDRRNRLKVYKALQRVLHRDTEGAAALFLDCIATFSCNELCSYTQFVAYAIITNILHLPRPELKKKVIDGPEIISVTKDIPTVVSIPQIASLDNPDTIVADSPDHEPFVSCGQSLQIKLVRSFYDCDYKTYLHALVELEDVLHQDRYLYPHASYLMRELHILAYKQFLDSYQSVTLDAMAAAFGVTTDFIDFHASRYIAANRLSAKIDKYGGVIVTNRPDSKNAQYREMIQKGDMLLNRIQKLARVVDL